MSVLNAFSLAGKVAFVTGANRGLGQAIAIGLAQAGADIAGLARSADHEATCAQVEVVGRRYHPIICDLATAADTEMQALPDQVVDALGRLDILVNNAGMIRRNPALDYSLNDWDAVIRVNLRAVFVLSQASAHILMNQQHGKIINIASMLSYQGGIFVPAYTASKHAVVGLTRALANEWASHGINVNAIAPGYMETDNTAALRSDAGRSAAILARIPAGHWGSPEALQGAAVFLASNAADYVHGATLDVDGGWLGR